jgi:hypothetical protein
MAPMTYTLDAQTPDGRFASDYGLTAQQVENAKANAPALGIKILAIIEETPVDPTALEAFGVKL